MSTQPSRPTDIIRVGRYELLAKLGEGGMGVVHLARGPQGERVALKVLRDHVVGDEDGRARLAREVNTLRRVRSPRVAEVYDADPWGDRPYVVTRYVPGRSLHEQVKDEGPLPEADLRYLALALAEAMVAVHEVGVVHRDIKPSNVLMEGRGPVLIDFGLAKLADDARLTVTGWLMGTPGYLAPEVLYGDDPTPASDVHSWAATVVYAASGRSPYGTGPAMAVMDRARRGEYDVSAVPADLQPLVARALSADPVSRPTGPELVVRLRQLQQPPAARADALGGTRADVGPLTAPMFPAPPPAAAATPVPAVTAPPPASPVAEPDTATTRPLTAPVTAGAVPARPPTPSPRRPSAAMRWALGAGMVAGVAGAAALAPYLTAVVVLVLTWLLRTTSLSGEAYTQRQTLRGPRRFDGVIRVVTWPWHLFVAVWGSIALLLAAAVAGGTVAAFATLVGQPAWQSLLYGGLLFTGALWWGPGSGRLRHPVRRGVWRIGVPDRAGLGWAFGVWLVAVVLLIAGARAGVVWYPDSGPPLADVLNWR